MHPTTLGTVVLLGRFVRPRPIALGIPPKSSEGEFEFRRQLDLEATIRTANLVRALFQKYFASGLR